MVYKDNLATFLQFILDKQSQQIIIKPTLWNYFDKTSLHLYQIMNSELILTFFDDKVLGLSAQDESKVFY